MISRIVVSLAVVLLSGLPEPAAAAQEREPPDTVSVGQPAQGAPMSSDRVEMDRQLRMDLMATFARIPGLEAVEASVDAGVVLLTGTTLTAGDGALADSLARRMPGVLYVENRIAEETSLRVRLRPVWVKVRERLVTGLALVPLLLVALLVTLFFFFLARFVYRWEALFTGIGNNVFLHHLLRQSVAAGVALLGVFLALQVLDATALVGAVLGAAGVVGIAVGFAFRNIAENYLAGILLSIRQPFFPNDQVLVEGQEGRVLRLTSRETVLMTLDGNHVRIPNAMIFNSVITNYTKNPLRRFRFDLSVGQREELTRVKEIAIAVIGAMEGILDDPAPRAAVVEVGDSSVQLRFFGWVDQNRVSFDKARSEAIRLTKEALDHAGVSMPAPEYGLRFLNPSAAIEGSPGGTPSAGTSGSDASASPAASEASPAKGTVPEPRKVGDISPDTELEAQIEKDREEAREPDLLDPRS